jgi:hypothetical protein
VGRPDFKFAAPVRPSAAECQKRPIDRGFWRFASGGVRARWGRFGGRLGPTLGPTKSRSTHLPDPPQCARRIEAQGFSKLE